MSDELLNLVSRQKETQTPDVTFIVRQSSHISIYLAGSRSLFFQPAGKMTYMTRAMLIWRSVMVVLVTLLLVSCSSQAPTSGTETGGETGGGATTGGPPPRTGSPRRPRSGEPDSHPRGGHPRRPGARERAQQDESGPLVHGALCRPGWCKPERHGRVPTSRARRSTALAMTMRAKPSCMARPSRPGRM